MSESASLRKRFALRLVSHAASMLPSSFSTWGTAMRHEIEYVQSDREALQWAIGCVSTSYLRRIASLGVVRTAAIRWIFAIFIASWTSDSFLSARFFYLKVVGSATPSAGEAYRQFIAVLEVMPTWSLMLGGIAGLFYIVAAYCLVRKKGLSVPILLLGTSLSGLACISQVVAVFQEYNRVLSPDGLQRQVVMFAVQFCMILLLWQSFKRDGKSGTDNKP